MSLLELVGSILTELEKVQEKLDRLLASRESEFENVFKNRTIDQKKLKEEQYHDLEELNKLSEPETEKEAQDLTQVLLFNETPKAFLGVKHGLQVWVAKSHLEDAEGYDLGNTYDLKVKEASKWVLKKLEWKKFGVFKD